MKIDSYTHSGEIIDKDIWSKLIVPNLTQEQFRAAWKAANKDQRGIIWWRIGEGKTRVAIAWMFMIANKPQPLIICSPGAIRQWLDEFDLLGVRGIIKAKFLSVGMLSRKNVTSLDLRRANCVVVDELWMFKNPTSNRSVMARQLTGAIPSIGLSGSMMTAGNIEDLYGQAKAMRLDKKIAETMTSFRQQFMIDTTNFAGFLQRFPRKGAVEAIQRRLIDHIDVNFPEKPRQIKDIPINVDPYEEQLKLKKKLLYAYNYQDAKGEIEIKNAATLLIKLQQISDGFLKLREGDYLYVKSSKSDRLKELCSELIDSGERLLIWVGFRKTAEILSKLLPYKTTTLSGDGKFDVFGWRDRKINITIATVGSGSSLNDFANVRYSIFYSTSFSSLNVQQARGRTNRKSSLHNCAYYYILATSKFPDKQIYEMIEDNASKEEIVQKVSQKVLAEANKK